MTKKVIIIGAGENGQVIANTLSQKYKIFGFLDDSVTGKNIIGKVTDFKKFIKTYNFFISIGNNRVRVRIFNLLLDAGAGIVNAIHNLSNIEKNVKIGTNVFIGAKSYVNVNSTLEDNVFINNGCIVEHDNIIKSGTHLAPGVITGGGVHIGSLSFIGLGTTINDHLEIGNNTIIGSGSVVINNLPDHVMAAGVPAKIIKKI